jgi:hypothetical protein
VISGAKFPKVGTAVMRSSSCYEKPEFSGYIMRKDDVIQAMQNLFYECCTGLFEGLDCQIRLSEHSRAEDVLNAPIACIDGGSEDIEFMVALQLPLEVLAMTYPVAEGITTIEENRLEDWISELSNQLIGKLKAKLIEHDCYVNIGLPTTYFGADVDELLSQNSAIAHYYFDIDGQICGCSISIEVFDDAMSFSIERNQSVDLQEGGELEFF